MCLCPATAACYHIVAARRAVGIVAQEKRGLLNLTQLRRNKRKRADKTGGRKRPRTADVDVVAATDADVGPGADLLTVGLQSPKPQPLPDPEPQATEIDGSICHACDLLEPPPRKNVKRQGRITRVKCDDCPRWYHCVCVAVRNTAASYQCDVFLGLLAILTVCVGLGLSSGSHL